MSRRAWAICLTVAWALPLAWLALLPWLIPSDGTVVSSPTAVLGEDRWGESLRVLETHGDTSLRTGDEIVEVEGRPVADLMDARDLAAKDVGDVVTYRVDRVDNGLGVRRVVEVRLTRYAVVDVIAANPHWLVSGLLLLLAGTWLALRKAPVAVAAATLGAGTALLVGASGQPFGVQAAALGGTTPMWPHVVGEVALALSLGAVAVAVWSFPRPPERLPRGRVVLLLAGPFLAYAAWMAVYGVHQPAPARLQAQLDLLLPAAVVTVVLVAVALATGRSRARSTEELLSVRLVVLALLAVLLVVGLLDLVPQVVRGSPLLPRELMAPLLAPLALGCWVAAVLHYRLVEIDAALRRSLVQGLVAAVLGVGFVAAANAVNLAAGTSVTALVTGGVVALILVPAAVVLSRTASRLAYGDRAVPSRVVADLRRLEPGLAPERSLQEVLALLSRRLRLSYASVETVGAPGAEALQAEVGQRRGRPTTVELEVAGSRVGRLEMEVDPLREPFGPRDRRLLEDVGTQVGALVQALVGNRELQRVRERLVATREEERRRLRRDLHDGLGPSLATRLMGLEAARDLVDRDPAQAAAILDRLADQTEADIGEVRRLVDGLRPPALELGLASALRERAAQHNTAVASASGALTWQVVADDLGPLPAAVEVAAYRIAVEAVTNAVRHSGGSRCTVTLRRQEGALEVEIRDDGVGAAGGRGTGVGLGSMRDRAEELGGTCTVSAEPGGGTLVVAVLPMAEPQPVERDGQERD